MGLLDVINGQGAGAQSGGCWTMFGSNSDCSFTFSTPVTLTIGGVVDTYVTGDVLPGGDNPDVTAWDCAGGDSCVLLIYRCSVTIAGCACPAGTCPAATFYKFELDDCCCEFPCDGEFEECSYFHDWGFTISAFTSNKTNLTSFVLDGIEYVPTDLILPNPNNILIGGFTYNTAFADLLNSIGIPDFTASYPTAAQLASSHVLLPHSSMRNNIIRLKFPSCLGWNIQMTNSDNGGSLHTWDFRGYSDDTNTNNLYVLQAPFDCVTTDLCP